MIRPDPGGEAQVSIRGSRTTASGCGVGRARRSRRERSTEPRSSLILNLACSRRMSGCMSSPLGGRRRIRSGDGTSIGPHGRRSIGRMPEGGRRAYLKRAKSAASDQLRRPPKIPMTWRTSATSWRVRPLVEVALERGDSLAEPAHPAEQQAAIADVLGMVGLEDGEQIDHVSAAGQSRAANRAARRLRRTRARISRRPAGRSIPAWRRTPSPTARRISAWQSSRVRRRPPSAGSTSRPRDRR